VSAVARRDSVPPSERRTCVDCNAIAPQTKTAHTLISREYGWRLLRQETPDGKWVLYWRCAACWQRYKGRPGP
jgi:hypothetical protein